MASIQGIYVALFGRPADPLGLAFFNEATNNGADLTAIGDLAATDEYQDRFAGMSNEEIVNSIYNSLFERDGEAEGVAYYVAALESGELDINNIAIAILEGAQGSDLDTVNAKIAAADLFTAGLDTDEEIEAYTGMDAAQIGVDFLAQVNADNPADTPLSDEWILKLFGPDEGQAPGGGGGGGGNPPAPTELEQLLEWQAKQNAAYDATDPKGHDREVNTDGVHLANAYVEYLAKGNDPILNIVHLVTNDDDVVTRAQTFHDNVLGHLLDSLFADGAERPVDDVRSDEAKEFGPRPWNGGHNPDEIHAADKWDLQNDVNRPDLIEKLSAISAHIAAGDIDGAYSQDFNGLSMDDVGKYWYDVEELDDWSGNGKSGLSSGSHPDGIDGKIVLVGEDDFAFRISNAATTGNYDYTWPFLPNVDKAGEGDAEADIFAFSFEFASAQTSFQNGLVMNVVLGAEGSAVRQGQFVITDEADGLKITFSQTTDQATSPGYAFDTIVIAEGLSRGDFHKVAGFVQFNDGSDNDIISISVGDESVYAGTWENYFENVSAEPDIPGIDTIGFRYAGTAEPGLVDGGLLFDNLYIASFNSTDAYI